MTQEDINTVARIVSNHNMAVLEARKLALTKLVSSYPQDSTEFSFLATDLAATVAQIDFYHIHLARMAKNALKVINESITIALANKGKPTPPANYVEGGEDRWITSLF
jgi:hypothetical protein